MSLELSVRKTIEYASRFGSHINVDEIKKRLISKKIYSEQTIDKEISKLKWKNKNNKWGKIKVIKAKKLASLVKNKFKDVLFLGISGSVACAHPKKNDDIDLLIITKADTLWKNRLLLRWWIYKNKIPHRKYNQTELKNQFCFNLWLDENNLKIPKSKQNLKNAIDLLLLKPLINKNYTYEKFIMGNDWASKFVATGYSNIVKELRIKNYDLRIEQSSFFKKIINMMFFLPQYWYMKPKILKEKIGLHQAFFHRQMIK